MEETVREPEDFCLAAEEHLKEKQKRIRYMKVGKKAVVLMYRGEKSAGLSEREKEFSEAGIPVLSVEIEEYYAHGGFFDSWLLIPSAGCTGSAVTESRETGKTDFRILAADVTKKERTT